RRARDQHRPRPRGVLRAVTQHHQRLRRRTEGMNHVSADATLHPYGLRAEQRDEPLGIDEPRPRLSWRLAHERRGAATSPYPPTAAERPEDLSEPARLLWDSGRRLSDQTLLVEWDGPALRSATRYHWRVEVWDETGSAAGSAQSWFETGLLHRRDWTAVWV